MTDEPQLNSLPLCSFEWTEVFAVLSLDLSRRFYEMIGLTVREPGRFQQVLRETISLRNPVILEWPSRSDIVAQQNKMIRAEFSLLSETLDQEDLGHFSFWASTTYCSRRTRSLWLPYMLQFRGWAARLEHRGMDMVGFGSARSVLELYRETTGMQDVEEAVQATRTAALSVWDEFVYELRKYENDLLKVEQANAGKDHLERRDPFELIVDTAEQFRFQQFLKSIVGELSEDEIDRVFSFVRTWDDPALAIVPPKELLAQTVDKIR